MQDIGSSVGRVASMEMHGFEKVPIGLSPVHVFSLHIMHFLSGMFVDPSSFEKYVQISLYQ